MLRRQGIRNTFATDKCIIQPHPPGAPAKAATSRRASSALRVTVFGDKVTETTGSFSTYYLPTGRSKQQSVYSILIYRADHLIAMCVVLSPGGKG